jgi:hypothetical protein
MESAKSWGRTGSRRGYNPIRDDRVSRYSLPRRRWTKGENAPHEASKRTEVKQVHATRAQVFGIDPEALELALDLIRPRIAARRPLRIPSLVVGVPVRPLALARCDHLCPGLEARRVEQRDAAARFGVLTPHVEAVVDPPA